MRGLARFLSDIRHLAAPYFLHSDDRWRARLLLATTLVLNLVLVGLQVVLSYWNRAFFNALQNKDQASYLALLFTWQRTDDDGLMPGFCGLVLVFIIVSIYATFLQQALYIRWRAWLTARLQARFLADHAFWRLGLTPGAGADNPDQRLAEDVRDFVDTTLTLGLSLVSNLVTLASFLGILWGLSGAYPIFGMVIPGYMVWVAVVYAMIGTALAHWVGRTLIPLSFQQQRLEADYRFALVRLRENVDAVALSGGEVAEAATLAGRFGQIVVNWRRLMQKNKQLNALTSGYAQLAVIFPFVVSAPRFFAGALTLGALTQTADAFGRVQGALSWIITNYSSGGGPGAQQSLTAWRAVVERLTGFEAALAAAHTHAAAGPVTANGPPDGGLALDALTLRLPNGHPLLPQTTHHFLPGQAVLISGQSGTGKSTLLRAIAGLWPYGSGRVTRSPDMQILPQRPYLPLGPLRAALAYPADSYAYPDAALHDALDAVGLGALYPRLDEPETDWARALSSGEQQRLAIARALLARPSWLMLDEATASLDPPAEAALYALLRARLPNTTLISIAHRPSLARFHDQHLAFPSLTPAAEPSPSPAPAPTPTSLP